MKERNPQRQRRTEKVVRKESQNRLVWKGKKKSASLNLSPMLAADVEYEYQVPDVQPLESVGECVGHREIPLSPQESSNKEVDNQAQMQKPHRALVEEQMEDGISISDLEVDLQEGQGSTSDLETFDEIFTGKNMKR